MSTVFVSYVDADLKIVEQITNALHQYVYDVWRDWSGLNYTVEGWRTILDAIGGSYCFICLISPGYAGDMMALMQLAEAIRLKKRIIPVTLQSVDENSFIKAAMTITHNDQRFINDNPISIAQDNWQVIWRLNWLSYPISEDSFDPFITQLVASIRNDLGYLQDHTHNWLRAKYWDERGRQTEFLLRGELLQEAILWLEASEEHDPPATELHRQYITESQQQAARHSSPLQQAIYAATYRLLGLGPHKIFISYRRVDSAYACGWMYDNLKSVFGQKNIFLDVDSIEFGTDFSQFIQRTLTECFVVLVVIGPQWVPILKTRGENNQTDLVRTEVELALRRKHLNVIPLLVGDVQMPQSGDLPASMQDLTLRNGMPLRAGRAFHQDMSVLIKELRKLRSQVKVDIYQ